MSNKVLTAVWDKSPQTGVALIALLSMADQAADDGYCWPSHSYIAQRARSTPKYIAEEIMPKLEKDGEIIVVQRPGTSNAYLVTAGFTTQALSDTLKIRFKMSDDEIYDRLVVQQVPRHTPPVKQGDPLPVEQGDSPPVEQGDSPPVEQGVNPKEPSRKPKGTISPSVSTQWEEDEDDFVEEVEYGPADPFASENESSLIPKWRDPDKYQWQNEDLMRSALLATGRKKFGTKKEWSAWRKIDKSMVSLSLVPKEENKYPTEWVALMVKWAADKNKIDVTAQGSFAVKIKFPMLVSAIENEAKKNSFVREWLKENSAELAEVEIESIKENPMADRLK